MPRQQMDRIAVVQGGTVSLSAARDILGQGVQLSATQNLQALAGRDLRKDAAGLKSLTLQAVDNVTGLPKIYY